MIVIYGKDKGKQISTKVLVNDMKYQQNYITSTLRAVHRATGHPP